MRLAQSQSQQMPHFLELILLSGGTCLYIGLKLRVRVVPLSYGGLCLQAEAALTGSPKGQGRVAKQEMGWLHPKYALFREMRAKVEHSFLCADHPSQTQQSAALALSSGLCSDSGISYTHHKYTMASFTLLQRGHVIPSGPAARASAFHWPPSAGVGSLVSRGFVCPYWGLLVPGT